MSIQALFDAMSREWQRERAATQLTLGELISTLEKMPENTTLPDLADPHSYRGFYEDLAFEPGEGAATAGELLTRCRSAVGECFRGYKGGYYTMNCDTPLWIAHYGRCGDRFISISADEGIETQPYED